MRYAAALLLFALTLGAQAPAGWTVLFDGKNLDNWDRVGNANWTLKDGIVEANAGQGFLLSKQSYGDVEIRAEFWVDGPANSGVFVRCSNRTEITQGNAYEVNEIGRAHV